MIGMIIPRTYITYIYASSIYDYRDEPNMMYVYIYIIHNIHVLDEFSHLSYIDTDIFDGETIRFLHAFTRTAMGNDVEEEELWKTW